MKRLRMLIIIAAAACSFCVVEGEENLGQGVIRGRVTDAATGAGVPSQTVRIAGTGYGAATDAEGRFVIANVPPGTYRLQVTGVGYGTAAAEVVLGSRTKTSDVAFTVGVEALPMAEVQITVDAAAKTPEMPVSMHTLSLRQVRTTAGSLDDIARTLAILPGVAPMTVARHDLIVRGGAPMENLFLIDNIEFPTISHFAVQGAGAGSSSMLNSDLIDGVAFSSGAFGARNGDRLSSVLSLTTRSGNRDRRAAAVTLSATQFGVTLEGPAPRDGSYLWSLRRSYLEPVFKAYDMSFAPVYWDVFAKASCRPGDGDDVEVLAMGSIDRMRLFNDSPGKRAENEGLLFSDQNMLTAGATWKHAAKHWYTMVTASNSYGGYSYYQDRVETSASSRIASHENEASLSVDGVVQAAASSEVSAGVRCKFASFRDDVKLGEVPWFLNVDTDLKEVRKFVDTSGRKFSAYVHVSQTLGRVIVNAGVRADHFSLIEHPLAIAPRLSVMYRLSPLAEVTVGGGRYYQSPAYVWLVNPYNMRLRHAGADHLMAGIARRIGNEWNISFEGYWKRYFDYPASIEAPCMTVFNAGSVGTIFKDFGLDSLTSTGSGASQGIELMVQKHASDSPVSGTLSLSYGKTMFRGLDGIARAADHDQRWVVNLVVDYQEDAMWGITTKFRLYTGHPYTDEWIMHNGSLAQYEQAYNGKRVGLNHMLDVRLMRRWNIGATRIEAFIDVQNIYDKKPLDTPVRDAATGRYNEAGTIGVVPSLGVTVSL